VPVRDGRYLTGVLRYPVHGCPTPRPSLASASGSRAVWLDQAEDEARIGWGRDAMAALGPFATSVNYVNDLGQLDQDAVRGAYGPAKYDRLVAPSSAPGTPTTSSAATRTSARKAAPGTVVGA